MTKKRIKNKQQKKNQNDETLSELEEVIKSIEDIPEYLKESYKKYLTGPSISVVLDDESVQESSSQMDPLRRKPTKRLSDQALLSIAKMDMDISSIVNTRVAQITGFAQPCEGMFDKGLKIVDLRDGVERNDFETEDQYFQYQEEKEKEMSAIWDFLKDCGDNDPDVLKTSFTTDSMALKYYTLREYLQSQCRNLIILGRMARENIYYQSSGGFNESEDQKLALFRPLPVESILPVREKATEINIENENLKDKNKEFLKNLLEENPHTRPLVWVQEIDNKSVAYYTEDRLTMSYYQKQANLETARFPEGPLETAITAVWLNHNINRTLENKFTNGNLNSSFLHLKLDKDTPKPNDQDLKKFASTLRRFSNGTINSSTIPILTGQMDAKFIPFMENKDEEWQEARHHIQRTLCSAFQIDPKELSWGQLGDSASLGQTNTSQEWEKGEERGLRILLDILTDDLNDIVYTRFPQFKDRYSIMAVGVGGDNQAIALERMESEQNLTATLNDLMNHSDKEEKVTLGGDMPLNPIWHQNVVRFLKMGDIYETFFGIEGASEDPKLDFFIDPTFQASYMAQQSQEAYFQLENNKLNLEMMKKQMTQDSMMQQPEQQKESQGEQQGSEGEQVEKTVEEPSLKDAANNPELMSDDDTPLKNILKSHDWKITWDNIKKSFH